MWHIGRFVLSEDANHRLVEEKVETWVEGVQRLEVFVRVLPQTE